MLDVCVANPLMSFVMFEKKSLLLLVSNDEIDDLLLAEIELSEILFADGIEVSLLSSSKLSCS